MLVHRRILLVTGLIACLISGLGAADVKRRFIEDEDGKQVVGVLTGYDSAESLWEDGIEAGGEVFKPLLGLFVRNSTLSGTLNIFFMRFSHMKELRLNGCKLESLGREYLLAMLPQLEIFDASNNQLVKLEPKTFSRCSKLKVVDLSRNRLTDLSGLDLPGTLSYFSCEGNEGLIKPPAFRVDLLNVSKCPKLKPDASKKIDAKVVWALRSGLAIASLKVHLAPGVDYAVGSNGTLTAGWEVVTKDWRSSFVTLLKRKIAKVCEKNGEIFHLLDTGCFDTTADGSAEAKVESFCKDSHAKKDELVQKPTTKTQVALRTVPVGDYGKYARALMLLFASVEERIKSIAFYCRYVAKEAGINPADSDVLNEVAGCFSKGRLLTLSATDKALLDKIFPAHIEACQTPEYVEFVAGIGEGAYNAWDQLYVVHKAIETCFQALLHRLLKTSPRDWVRSPEFTAAEKTASGCTAWAPEWNNVYAFAETLGEVVSILVKAISEQGGLFDAPVPTGKTIQDELWFMFSNAEYCVTTARKLQGL